MGTKLLQIRTLHLLYKESILKRTTSLLLILCSATYLLLGFLGSIGISYVFVDIINESSGGSLSLLVFLLLVSTLSLEETSLCLKG